MRISCSACWSRIRTVAITAGTLVLTFGSLRAADPPPTAAEEARFVEATRAVARSYVGRLPDFLCAQTVRRYLVSANKKERLIDTLTLEAGYYDHEEHYEITKVNGHSVGPDHPPLSGLQSSGLFTGTMVRVLASHADFRFVEWAVIDKRAAAIYSYHASSLDALFALHYRDPSGGQSDAVVGLRGEVAIDRETYGALRFEYAADGVPDSFPMRGSGTIEYDYITVGSGRYWLPVKAVLRSSHARVEERNEVDFLSYRNIASVPDFQPVEQPPRW